VLVFHVHAIFHEFIVFQVFVCEFGDITEMFKIPPELEAHDKYLSAFSSVILLSPDAR
jgi:hypothetical protein